MIRTTRVLETHAWKWERPSMRISDMALQMGLHYCQIDEKIGLFYRVLSYQLQGDIAALEEFNRLESPKNWGYKLPGTPNFMYKRRNFLQRAIDWIASQYNRRVDWGE